MPDSGASICGSSLAPFAPSQAFEGATPLGEGDAPVRLCEGVWSLWKAVYRPFRGTVAPHRRLP